MAGFAEAARWLYAEMGFDTLPLIPGSKAPLARSWQSCSPHRLWRNTPENANIGIRGGGEARAAMIDCDEPRTFEIASDWLAGLGYRPDSYPVVQTASGTGRHIYIAFAGGLGGDWRKLSCKIGKGEFRFGAGSQVAAPPSVISNGGSYSLLAGDFTRLPYLELDDVLQIVNDQETVATARPTLSRKAVALLHGKNIETYNSRSEAEQSLIASLVNSGFSSGEVLKLFNRNPCAGRYAALRAANARNAERWLSHSYDEAARWTVTHESKARQFARAAMAWAEFRAWPGRTGAVDRLVYIAHAQIAYRAGRLTYAAACRDLAERAGIGFRTAIRATWRLCASGLIVPERKAVADLANVYQLGQLDKLTHSPNTPTVRKCVSLSAHDTFRFGGLGRSAGEVWDVLQEQPASVIELAKVTGRHVRTIERAIGRMAKLADPLTGETLPMVASEDGQAYHALPIDLDRIAHALGTAGAGERQRREHARDRRMHARSLENGNRKG